MGIFMFYSYVFMVLEAERLSYDHLEENIVLLNVKISISCMTSIPVSHKVSSTSCQWCKVSVIVTSWVNYTLIRCECFV